MSETPKYIILHAPNVDLLQRGVNAKLEQGYILAGNAFVFLARIHQPMVQIDASSEVRTLNKLSEEPTNEC